MRGGVTNLEWSESISKLSLAKQCAFYNSKYKVVNRTKNKGIDAGGRLLLKKPVSLKDWSQWLKPTQRGLLIWIVTRWAGPPKKESLGYQIEDYPTGFVSF